MARYTGPKDKLSRRFGVALFGPTKALEHKNYPPGMHGPKGSRRKHSDYSLALAEKQKLRFQYGVLERQFRRYFGVDGTSYAGATYSHGLSREEIRSIDDLARLHSNSVRGELDILFGRRLRVDGSVTASHQERVDLAPVWQTTLTAGFAVLF